MSKKLKLFAQFKKRAIFKNRGDFRSGLRDEALACLREKTIGKRTTREKEIIHAFITRTAKYFSSLPPEVLRRYLDFLYHRRFSHNQTVFTVGEPEEFFLVLSGQVTISKPASRSSVTEGTMKVMKPFKVCFLGDVYNENVVESAKRGHSIFEAKAECKPSSPNRESRIRLRAAHSHSGPKIGALGRTALGRRAAATESSSAHSHVKLTSSPPPSHDDDAEQHGVDVVDLLMIDFDRLERADSRARMEHIINEFEIFHDLSRDVVLQIVEGATMSHFKAGEVIQQEHQTPELACLILSGVASVQWPVEGENIGADRQWITTSAAAASSSKTSGGAGGAGGAGPGATRHTVNVLQLCKGELANLLETTHGVACPYRLVAAERVEALLLPKSLLKLFPRDRRELMQATAYAVMESWRERVHGAVQFVCQASSEASSAGADLTKRPREWGLDGRTLTNPRVDRSKSDSGAQANDTKSGKHSDRNGRGHDHDDSAAPAGINAYEAVLQSFHKLTAVARARQGEQVRINQHQGKAAAKEAAKLAARNKTLKASGEGGSGPGDTSARSPEETSARARARWKSVGKLATFVTRTSQQAVLKSNSVVTDKVVQTLLKGHGGGDAAKELHRKIGTEQAHDKLTSMLDKLRQRRAIDDQMSLAMGKKVVTSSGSRSASGVYLTEVPELDDERPVAESSGKLKPAVPPQRRDHRVPPKKAAAAAAAAANRLDDGWVASSGRPRIVVDNSASGQQAISAKLLLGTTGANRAGKSSLPTPLRGGATPRSTHAAWAGSSSALAKNQRGGDHHPRRQGHHSRSNSSGSTLPSLAGHSGLHSRV